MITVPKRDHHMQLYSNAFSNLDGIGQFLENLTIRARSERATKIYKEKIRKIYMKNNLYMKTLKTFSKNYTQNKILVLDEF
jgi:hypothetical protein